MTKLTLKNITTDIKVAQKAFNTELFESDREHLDNLRDIEWTNLLSIDTTSNQYDIQESYLGFTKQNDAYLVNIRQSSYNGEVQINASIQNTTLKGTNYFFKKTKESMSEELPEYLTSYYDNMLSQVADFTLADIKEVAEFQAELNCSILRCEDDKHKWYFTINNEGMLTKITKKLIETKQQAVKEAPKSLLQQLIG